MSRLKRGTSVIMNTIQCGDRPSQILESGAISEENPGREEKWKRTENIC